ncbi:hypothetical protein FHR81_001986 [Actinoalloteichus hoggarensis]|uniref:Uncharacterized protein n=1 Tax=Actinoalloteichus hoggarensis TaxID=1470176 RepID=A0A221W6I4_9PSEU|nr:hypothetical protein AHOG_16955 [Actinoalloteichus hoggarensis]MBB5920948.1 hypothetical protein [Actinoalloteichus hoggarensis]
MAVFVLGLAVISGSVVYVDEARTRRERSRRKTEPGAPNGLEAAPRGLAGDRPLWQDCAVWHGVLTQPSVLHRVFAGVKRSRTRLA